MREFSDPYARDICFAQNAAFWLSYSCLETTAVAQSREDNEYEVFDMRNLNSLQEIAMQGMRRLLEDSDFLKHIIVL